jgi:hypothetical protein
LKSRFVVVDFGSAVHARNEGCPPWCHLCPHMNGGVMPYCFGSICHNADEWDLLGCTCDPSDPIVAHIDLISRTDRLMSLLRDKRRDRRSDVIAARRLVALAQIMRHSLDQKGLRAAWEEVENIGQRLISVVSERERERKEKKG